MPVSNREAVAPFLTCPDDYLSRLFVMIFSRAWVMVLVGSCLVSTVALAGHRAKATVLMRKLPRIRTAPALRADSSYYIDMEASP